MNNSNFSDKLNIVAKRIESTYINYNFVEKEKNILSEICKKKSLHVEANKEKQTIQDLINIIKKSSNKISFLDSIEQNLKKEKTAIIAEIKKASPSAGMIRENFSVPDIAKDYYEGGACCISVLTDTEFFQGKDIFIKQVKENFSIPVLRKDFIIDPYQVVESKALGADCILLIMSILSNEQAQELEFIATCLEMDVLLEVHNEEELKRAMCLNSRLIGINNRNLKTMKTDLNNTKQLSSLIPNEYIIVCESGIHTKEDISKVKSYGVNSFLIGESIMKKDNIKEFLSQLIAN